MADEKPQAQTPKAANTAKPVAAPPPMTEAELTEAGWDKQPDGKWKCAKSFRCKEGSQVAHVDEGTVRSFDAAVSLAKKRRV